MGWGRPGWATGLHGRPSSDGAVRRQAFVSDAVSMGDQLSHVVVFHLNVSDDLGEAAVYREVGMRVLLVWSG